MGGAGGGAWTVLAIFHLSVDLARRLLRRRNTRGRRRRGLRLIMFATLDQLQYTYHEKNQRPSVAQTWYSPPAIVQILQQSKHADRDEHSWPNHAAIATVAMLNGLSPSCD